MPHQDAESITGKLEEEPGTDKITTGQYINLIKLLSDSGFIPNGWTRDGDTLSNSDYSVEISLTSIGSEASGVNARVETGLFELRQSKQSPENTIIKKANPAANDAAAKVLIKEIMSLLQA